MWRFLPYSTFGCSSLLTGRSAVGGPAGGSVVVVMTRLLLRDDDPEDVLVVDDADDAVPVGDPARTLVVEHDAGGVADDLGRTGGSARRRCRRPGSRITHFRVSTCDRGTSLTKSRT